MYGIWRTAKTRTHCPISRAFWLLTWFGPLTWSQWVFIDTGSWGRGWPLLVNMHFSHMASDWLAALLPANQKLCLKILDMHMDCVFSGIVLSNTDPGASRVLPANQKPRLKILDIHMDCLLSWIFISNTDPDVFHTKLMELFTLCTSNHRTKNSGAWRTYRRK